jgi:hypothetical protein
MTLTIHPDLRSLIPPLTPEELAQLEANLLAEGCRDSLLIWRWQGEEILLDGHNRHDLCERHGLTYAIHEVSLPDLDAAKAWMIANQLGRRNLTPNQISYFRGTQYNLQKRQGKRTDLTSPQTEGKSHTTAHALAAEHHVGRATIEREGVYATRIDTIAATVGITAVQTVAALDSLPQSDVQAVADLAQIDAARATQVVTAVQTARTPKAARAQVDTAVQDLRQWVAQVGSGNLAEAGVARGAPRPVDHDAAASCGAGPCARHLDRGARPGAPPDGTIVAPDRLQWRPRMVYAA